MPSSGLFRTVCGLLCFFVGTATQLVILPTHIQWKGQGGGILLSRYSMICVSGLTIYYCVSEWIFLTINGMPTAGCSNCEYTFKCLSHAYNWLLQMKNRLEPWSHVYFCKHKSNARIFSQLDDSSMYGWDVHTCKTSFGVLLGWKSGKSVNTKTPVLWRFGSTNSEVDTSASCFVVAAGLWDFLVPLDLEASFASVFLSLWKY